MDKNVIQAVFDSTDKARTRAAFQYDYGQVLKVAGVELPEAYEVHFSNEELMGDASTAIGDANGVLIPDIYFRDGRNIYAWIYLHSGEDDGETVYRVTIPINKRSRPIEGTPTPVQQDVITQAIAALNAAVETTNNNVIIIKEIAAEIKDLGLTVEERDGETLLCAVYDEAYEEVGA